MRRLPLIDAGLLAVLLSLSLAALVLHVRQMALGGFQMVGVYLSSPETPDAHPTVSGIWPGAEQSGLELAVGDRLLRLGSTDLSGVGPLRFFALAQEQRARALQEGSADVKLHLEFQRGGAQGTTMLPFVPVRFPWRMLPLTAGLVVTGTLALLRRPGTAVARRFFLGTTVFSLHWSYFFGGNPALTYAWMGIFAAASTLMFPLVLFELALFPPEVAPARTPRWPWLFAATGPLFMTANLGFPPPPELGLRGIYLSNLAIIPTIFAVLAVNYRRAGPRGRRQLKWKLYGLYAGLFPVLVANVVTLYAPALRWLNDLAAIAMVLIPICLLIAITRFNLLDIDRLITSTVAYSILSVALLAVVLAVVPWLAEAASETLALDRRIGTGILSALAAVSLLALYRSLAPRVERVLFRERFALESGVTGLLDVIASLGDPRAILDFVGRRLSELFLPATCVVYEGLPSVDRLVPAFSSGTIARPGGLPTLSLHGSLALVLGRSTGPVSLEDATGERRALDVDQAESALVESLAPTVLLPIKAGEDLQGVISLGAKRSGDVYSSGELALLGAVADKVATRLEQIDLERRTATGPLVLPRKFELVERIGQGGMGIVFKVRHVALDTFVALKILPEHLAREPEFVRRFHREARLMAQLHHPSIVRVLDIDSEGSLHYFVMEYVAGHTLAELLREQGPLPLLRAVDVALQVAGALEHAHRHEPSVVHRDVTPSNILIEKETGRVVVTDFGIAKVAEAQAALTRTGDLFGKPRYAAPEQLRGDREIDARADIYSLGVVLHEMFAGHQIFAGLDDQTVLRRVAYEAGEIDFDFTRMTPEAFRTIVARAVAKDPERRYRSAADLIADLLRLRASLDDTATSPTETTTHAGASRASSLQEAGGLDATIAVAKRSRTSEP